MERLFLAWVAALVAASWVGITLAEAGAFAAAPVVVAAVAAAGATFLALRGAAWPDVGRARWALPLLALALTVTLLPVVDTTLVSQDASIHRASGRWLARTGALGIPDPSFAPLAEEERLHLFGGASVSPQRMSLTRLPGGIVLPDTTGTVAYPSFSHLLAVWVALADRLGGETAIAALGPLLAATAWWAIGLLALLDAGLLAALAAPLLLAALLPEHWFARYLMPEILAQALVWTGVAAARLAEVAHVDDARARDAGDGRADARAADDGHASRASSVAALLAGAALGVSGFARLEQFWVFVPALLLTRALLPRDRRLLPRGALLPFVLLATHAVAHAFLVPTDYANRIYKTAIHAYAPFVVLVSTLTGHDGYKTTFLLNRVLPAVVVGGLIAWLWIGRRVDRTRPGFLRRWSAAAIAVPWFALIYRSGMPDHFAALRSLLLYVPWTIWPVVALGALRVRRWSGLEIALVLQAIDQLVHARVTDLQPWASRRVVTVVLPVVVLAAVRALARSRDRAASEGAAGDTSTAAWSRPRPAIERSVATALVALTIVLAATRVAPLAGRAIQTDGAGFVAQVAAELPPSAYVVVAEPLAWTHLAAALWLGEGPTTLVAREQPWFPPALARFLALPDVRDRPLYVLAGAVDVPGVPTEAQAVLPQLPDDLALEPVRTFEWTAPLLQATVERRPHEITERSLGATLYRLVPRSG